MAEEEDRTKFIGSSDCASILGLSKWKKAYKLYLEKIGESKEEISKRKEEIFYFGKKQESIILDFLVDLRGYKITKRNVIHIDVDYPYIRAEIDAEGEDEDGTFNIEIKTTANNFYKEWGSEYTDDIPLQYMAQIQHAMMVTKRDRCLVCVLIAGNDTREHWVLRDNEIISMIREREVKFWDMVQNKIPPEIETLEDFKKKYPVENGNSINSNVEIESLLLKIKADKENVKDWCKRIKENEFEVLKFMGENSYLIDQSGDILVTLLTTKRKSYEKKIEESTFRTLRIK